MSSSLDQELRIQLLEQATYNGILMWKIDEIGRRMDGAIKGIFSAPFYSDPRGYKMCDRKVVVDCSDLHGNVVISIYSKNHNNYVTIGSSPIVCKQYKTTFGNGYAGYCKAE